MKYLDKNAIPWSENMLQRQIFVNRYLKNYACIPNVLMNNNGYYEADMVLINYNSGYLQEIECKVSIEDFRADFKKKHYHDHPHVRQLYYAMPEQMWNDHKDEIVQLIEAHGGEAGIITCPNDGGLNIVKRAKTRKGVERLEVCEILKYLRLGCMKIWI